MKTACQQQFFSPSHKPVLEIRTTRDSLLPYAEHFHSSFSFGLILDGSTRFFLGKQSYLAQAGDIVLIAPRQVHRCNPLDEKPRSYQMIHLDAEWFHQRIGMALYNQQGLRITAPLIRAPILFTEARTLFNRVCAGETVPETELAQLLIKIHDQQQCFTPEVRTTEHYSNFLTKSSVTEQIIAGNYTISALARAVGVRRESFSRAIYRAIGLPPSCYLHCIRLEYGRHLLKRGYSVAQTAQASGYVDQSHFHRMFVKYCSVTPGNYRKNRSHPYKK